MGHALNTPERLYYLDAVRAFALLLGIVFHASLSFVPVFIGWAVMDISTSAVVSQFVLISHSFRMELFFLIAGFFSHRQFHHKGRRQFVASRLVRIALPFVIGWFLLRPLLVSGWIMGAESLRGDVDILGALLAGFATLGELPRGLFTGTHLWFLYYLLLLTGGALVLSFLVGLYAPARQTLTRWTDNALRWFARSRMAIVAAAVPTAVCLWFMTHWGMDTPDKSLIPQVPVLLIYGGFFLLGWGLQRQPPLIEHFARLAWSKVAVLLLAVTAVVILSRFESNPNHQQYNALKGAFAYSYALLMWSLVSLTIGVFKKLLHRPNALVRYIADASYWLYLIHLPVVVWLQVAFAELAWHWSIKLFAISSLTIVFCLVLYDLLVRATVAGVVLNGKRKSHKLIFSGGTSV